MRHSRLWTGLASVTSFFLVTSIVSYDCMMGYSGTVNQALGIQTSKVVNDGAEEAPVYYESKYGELNAENLQKLIADTYEEAVAEEAVVGILTGDVNPSGHLTDTYAYSSVSAPSVVNGSYNNQTWANLDEVIAAIPDAEAGISYSTVQAEGIYIGYKYYETRYEDSVLGQGNADASVGSTDGKGWSYVNEVQYPFGYGLSYSEYEQTLDDVVINGDDIAVTVTVKNVGNVAGKSAVQVYAQTPYGDYEKNNLVEKSAIQLLDFGKTDLLAPGESQTLTINCDKYLLTSYDYTKTKGYILSEGD